MKYSAIFSKCERYRYELRREWDCSLPPMLMIMLNPSTADALKDDPTIRRCIQRAVDSGCGQLIVVNLFAWRSPNPRDLKNNANPVGALNDKHISDALYRCHHRIGGKAVAAWGAHGGYMQRNAHVAELARDLNVKLHCLGVTKSGDPRHPLYVAKAQPLIEWPISKNQ